MAYDNVVNEKKYCRKKTWKKAMCDQSHKVQLFKFIYASQVACLIFYIKLVIAYITNFLQIHESMDL